MWQDLLNGLRGLVLKGGLPDEERRITPRVRCYYPVECRSEENPQVIKARVVEMGAQGMRLESDQAVARGLMMQIQFHPEQPPVACRVVWHRKVGEGAHRLGVRYATSGEKLGLTWVGHVLDGFGIDHLDQPTRRRHPRLDADLPGMVDTTEVIVLNLGVGGALVESSQPLEAASTLHLPARPGAADVSLPCALIEAYATGSRCRSRLRFDELNRSQVRRLGDHLVVLMRQAP